MVPTVDIELANIKSMVSGEKRKNIKENNEH